MGTNVTIPRVCLVCEHFSFSIGSEGYSEWTPGSPGQVDCAKYRKTGCAWPDRDDTEPFALRSIAERCELFEVHSELKEQS